MEGLLAILVGAFAVAVSPLVPVMHRQRKPRSRAGWPSRCRHRRRRAPLPWPPVLPLPPITSGNSCGPHHRGKDDRAWRQDDRGSGQQVDGGRNSGRASRQRSRGGLDDAARRRVQGDTE